MQRQLNIAGGYDVAVIGGGVHGAAIAWEAARSGYSVLLVEQRDFVSGASSNSLKIIHGGLRYLQGLDWPRSRASAREQETLMQLAPHWVRPLPCAMPTYREWMKSRLPLRAGLWLYDHCVRSRAVSRQYPGSVSTLDRWSELTSAPLAPHMTGVAEWTDAQLYNSERLVLAYLWSARALGASLANHAELAAAPEMRGGVHELTLIDKVTGRSHPTTAKHLVDTAGALAGAADVEWMRGVNLVVPERMGDRALGLAARAGQVHGRAPSRLLFFTPWREVTLVGTWYFPDRPELGERITRGELEACVEDIAAVWPRIAAAASRPEAVHVGRLPARMSGAGVPRLLERARVESQAGRHLTRVTGVKYTTARLVAREAVARIGADLPVPGSPAPQVMHGAEYQDFDEFSHARQRRYGDLLPAATLRRLIHEYGSAMDQILDRCHAEDNFETIADTDNVLQVEVGHAVEEEMAVHLDDVLLRRLGVGVARRPTAATVNHCARLMGSLLGWDADGMGGEKARVAEHYARVVADPGGA